jgi:hypothetical protein
MKRGIKKVYGKRKKGNIIRKFRLKGVTIYKTSKIKTNDVRVYISAGWNRFRRRERKNAVSGLKFRPLARLQGQEFVFM